MTDRSTPLATVGLTRDACLEIGMSRTIDLPIARVRAYLTSEQGVRRWLGEGLKLPASPGDLYATADGTTARCAASTPRTASGSPGSLRVGTTRPRSRWRSVIGAGGPCCGFIRNGWPTPPKGRRNVLIGRA